MKLIVNPHKIEIFQEEAVNEKEINISKCEFEFNEDITDNFVKEAYFTLNGNTYKKVIVNDECTFPQEVLVKEGTIELGVVAYLVENEQEIKRYNPTPVYFKTDLGSLKEAQNSEEITPSEMEQYEQALQDGLSEVNDKLIEIDDAILQANTLDADVNKEGSTATITITKKDGTTKSVNISDGAKGDKGDTGETGPQGIQGPKGDTGETGATGPQGPKGDKGDKGDAGLTEQEVQDLIDASIEELGELGFTPTVVQTLPVQDIDTHTIYLVPKQDSEQEDAYDEWLYINNAWEHIGSTAVDLSNYYTKSEIVAITGLLSNLITSDQSNLVSAINEIVSLNIPLKILSQSGDRFDLSTLATGIYMVNSTNGYKWPGRIDSSTPLSKMILIKLNIDDTHNIAYILNPGINNVSAPQGGYKVIGFDNNTFVNNEYSILTSSAQTINGIKTFSALPVSTVVPINDNQFTNKKYVDDAVASVPTPDMSNYYTKTEADNIFDATPTLVLDNIPNRYFTGGAISDTEIINFFGDIINALYNQTIKYGFAKVKYRNSAKTELWYCVENVSNQTTQYNFYLMNNGVIDTNDNTKYYVYAVRGSWSDNVFNASTIYTVKVQMTEFVKGNQVLTKTNTSSYIPTTDYNPATKKYVDDSISNKIWIGTQTEYDALTTYSDSTLYFIKEDTNASE